jgi:glycosyltransferase involved in cell wall biosynthesis
MRVLHWYPSFLGGGGVANAVAGLISAQSRAGITVAIAAAEPRGSPLYESMTECLAPEVEVICWRPKWTLKWRNMELRGLSAKDRRALVAWKPDIVHVHAEFNPDNLRVPRLFDCPVVLSPHGAFHPVIFAKSNRLGKQFYLRVAIPLLYRKVHFHVLTPYLKEQGNGIFPFATWYIAPNGPSLVLEPFLGAPRRSRGAGPDPVRFLYVGRLHVHTKGLDLLLDALALALRKPLTRKAHLTLVGPDWAHGRNLLEAKAKALGIAPYVEITGPKMGKDLAAAYQESDIYVQTSRHEGQSLAATDALLFGMPAILTDTIALCSYPEVAGAAHVLLVPPQVEAIAEAITDAILRVEELQLLADKELPRLTARFSWEAIPAIHREHYSEMIAERAGTSRT